MFPVPFSFQKACNSIERVINFVLETGNHCDDKLIKKESSVKISLIVAVGKMQLSDREIQNTLDLLKKKGLMSEEEEKVHERSDEELEEVREFARRIGQPPEVRQDKIEKLKKAIETSSYNVTGDEIAKKLIGRMISDKLR